MLPFFRSSRFHLAMVIVWALLLVPTLVWWKSSILWVAAMSLYANIAAHWGAFQGARAERKASERALPGSPRLAPAGSAGGPAAR